jgi:hypothetical protein
MKVLLKILILYLICLPVAYFAWGSALGPMDATKVAFWVGATLGSILMLRVVVRQYTRNYGHQGYPGFIDRLFSAVGWS